MGLFSRNKNNNKPLVRQNNRFSTSRDNEHLYPTVQ